ncbi:MAG: site-2 protease family protein [Candidatus Andeanibacterium colombiense]|uniref:Site-2 protease family protein n=1 Tax=Candidatus Andeanibacterium colombiense TaxID=3121345 RepID=A0AAJ5X568_9SPHN|nr:MAG: site-2 protease family protein [Sphingomonadaceae bacterium]
MDGMLYDALTLIIPLVFAIVFHEVAHGYVAKLLGDPTAQERRRLTLNPIRHVDPFGTVVLPGFLALVGAPVFGWAKPVPVDARRLRNPRYGMMAVAAAGPGSNLVMAAIAAVVLGFLLQPYLGLQQPTGVAGFVAANLLNFIAINIFLALFNLIPIPPFDGSHILEGLLPREAARKFASFQRYGLILMVLLLVVVPYVAPQLGLVERIVLPPATWLQERYFAIAEWVAHR